MTQHSIDTLPTIKKEEIQALVQSHCPSVLTEIYAEQNNIVIWKPPLRDNLLTNIHSVLRDNRVINIVKKVNVNSASEDIKEFLARFEGSETLALHITELVDMFCCLFDLSQVGLRLTKLEQAMCPRFHVDRVPCRLVTTLYGYQGTQWLPNHVVNRQKLGLGNDGKPDDQSGLYCEQRNIQNIAPFDVALLKGEAWDGNEGRGLVHRSPANTPDEPRLVLTIDFV
ncbi:MAG: DUF1826 domain-containing protein [Paraglaciecola sp.]|uniref:DUF1826 domain-containing protein n=1 Tax=Paraglaciecola sp. TaxID=1920173 RepID=UPI0032968489